MHPTHRATELVLGLLGLFFLCCGFPASAAEQIVLDLTAAPVAGRHSLGVPGSSVSNIARKGHTGDFYSLPLRLQINKLTELDGGTKIRLELMLMNTGDSPLTIPACVDAEKAPAKGAVGRRTLYFGLVFSGLNEEIDQGMDATFGSASRPECVVVLDPRDSLLVIDEIHVPNGTLNRDITSVKAVLHEWKIEDGRYFIQAQSQRVESKPVEVPAGK
jgi:hypothetical protein